MGQGVEVGKEEGAISVFLRSISSAVLPGRVSPHCLMTSQNSENVMKAIDSAFVQCPWRGAGPGDGKVLDG
jgi:hypothetical protein